MFVQRMDLWRSASPKSASLTLTDEDSEHLPPLSPLKTLTTFAVSVRAKAFTIDLS